MRLRFIIIQQSLNKEITNAGELGNDEYVLKSFIWLMNTDDSVYALGKDKPNERYDFLCEYTDKSYVDYDDFNRMYADCTDGKLDLIQTLYAD